MTNVKAGVPQGSTLRQLSFLIHINGWFILNTKLFGDNTSPFSVIHDSVLMTSEINSHLVKIKLWAFQWKMSFNPDLNKHDQEVIVSRTLKKICHLPLGFKNSNFSQASLQKHLGLPLWIIG